MVDVKRFLILALACLGLAAPARAQSFDMRDYFPAPSQYKQLAVQFRTLVPFPTPENFALLVIYSRVEYEGRAFLRRDDYSLGSPLNPSTWYLRRDPVRGMLEVRDDSPTARLVYLPGKEIIWGARQQAGDVIGGPVQVDMSLSTGLAPGSPTQYGANYLTFEAFHPTFTNVGGRTFQNVIQSRLYQHFCLTLACAGPDGLSSWELRYWHAEGMGEIQVEWTKPGAGRIDYADTWQWTILPGSWSPAP